jgi:hypothetical protein
MIEPSVIHDGEGFVLRWDSMRDALAWLQSVDRGESAPCGECAQRGKHHRFCSLFAA